MVMEARAASLPPNCTEARNLQAAVVAIRAQRLGVSVEKKRGLIARLLRWGGTEGGGTDGVIGYQMLDEGGGGLNLMHEEIECVRSVVEALNPQPLISNPQPLNLQLNPQPLTLKTLNPQPQVGCQGTRLDRGGGYENRAGG